MIKLVPCQAYPFAKAVSPGHSFPGTAPDAADPCFSDYFSWQWQSPVHGPRFSFAGWGKAFSHRFWTALWAMILLTCAGAIVISPVRAAETQRTIVRVGVYENPPKVYTNPDGIVVGIFPDIIDTVAHEKGWQLEYVFGTWEECLERLENNAIDIMPDIAHSTARGEKFLFSDEPVFLNWAAVYVRSGTTAECLLDLKDKTVAVVKADIHTVGENGIQQLDQKFELNLTYVYVDGYRQVFEALEHGDVDAGIVNRLYGSISENKYEIARSPLIFNPVHLKVVMNELAETVRRVLDEKVQASN